MTLKSEAITNSWTVMGCMRHRQAAKKEYLRDQKKKDKTRDVSCDQSCHRRGNTGGLLTWTNRPHTLGTRENCHCGPGSAVTSHTPLWQKGEAGPRRANIESGRTERWWTGGDANTLLSFRKRPWAVFPQECGVSYPTGVLQRVCSPQKPRPSKQDQCTCRLTVVFSVVVKTNNPPPTFQSRMKK